MARVYNMDIIIIIIIIIITGARRGAVEPLRYKPVVCGFVSH